MASAAASRERPEATGSGDPEGFWGCVRGPPAPLFPLLPHFSGGCSPLPCYGFLQQPPLGLLTQQASSAPCQLPRTAPVLWPGPLFCSPFLQPGATGDPSRPKAAAASRESTAALKAWLDRHPKNPYPSKGEKVLLAVVSGMSLTQVSTWFANARRRLKKESRACWAPRGPPAAQGGQQEEEAEEEEEESDREPPPGARADPGTPRPPNRKSPTAPRPGAGAAAAAPWQKAAQEGSGPGAETPSPAAAGRAKIWRVAELATAAGPPLPGKEGAAD